MAGGWRFKTAEELRAEGYIPEQEAVERLGLAGLDALNWDYVEAEQTGADRGLWVLLKKRYRGAGSRGSGMGSRRGPAATNDPAESWRDEGALPAKKRKLGAWVSVKAAAEYLGVNPRTIYNLLKRGILHRRDGFRPALIKGADVERRLTEDWYAETKWAWERNRRPKLRAYRRDGVPLVTDEEVLLCEPYGYMAVRAEKEKIEDWEKRFRRDEFDYGEERDWTQDLVDEKRTITSKQAMEILEIGRSTLFGMVKRGKLAAVVVGKGLGRRALFSREQVERLADARYKKIIRGCKSPAEWAHDLLRPHIKTTLEARPGDRLISRREAAAILGVSLMRVTVLVRQGRLMGWQAHPGRQGVPLWVSLNQVTYYAQTWDRERRRRCWEGTAVPGVHKARPIPGVPTEQEDFMERHRVTKDGTGNLELNHGEFFSVGQAARELGVGRTTVHALRQRGDLLGFRRRRTTGMESYGRRAWWFFRKEDVWALKLDAQYAERSRRAKAARAEWLADRQDAAQSGAG